MTTQTTFPPPPPPTLEKPSDPPNTLLLALALALGIGFDVLAWGHRLGAGSALAGVGIVVSLYRSTPKAPTSLAAAAAVFFGSLAWRSSPVLQSLNLYFGISATGLMMYRSTEPGWMVRNALTGALAPWAEAVPRGIQYIKAAAPILAPDASRTRASLPWVRGALVSIPFVIVFGVLFASADATFADLAARLFDFEISFEAIARHVGVSIIATLVVVGLWRYPTRTPLWDETTKPRAFDQEASVVLAILVVLFAAFVGVQFSHFFGNGAGATLAQAARRGFFELVTVSGLVIVTILLSDAITTNSKYIARWSMGLVGLTMSIWFSAIFRMTAYVDAFGLTQLRFYTTVFMAWVGILLFMVGPTILKGRRATFVRRGVAAAFVLMITVTIANPDGLITRVNLTSSVPLDLGYVGQLSLDRGPALAAMASQNCDAARVEFVHDAVQEDGEDWRSWSWSRYQAEQLLVTWSDC